MSSFTIDYWIRHRGRSGCRRPRRRDHRHAYDKNADYHPQTGEAHVHLRTLYVDMVSDPGDPKADASASLLSADAERVLIAEILGADVHETLHHVVRFETVDQDEAAIDELMEGFYHDLAPDEYPDEGKA